MIPLKKFAGADYCSDMLTKNWTSAELDKNLMIMYIQSRKGRSEKAAKLHLLDHDSSIDFLKAREKLAGGQAAGDRWLNKGLNGVWHRVHSSSPFSLLTPFKVTNGPSSGHELSPTRFTQGITKSGRRFEFHDSWQQPERRHFRLGDEWIGTTVHFDRNLNLAEGMKYATLDAF